MSTHKDLPPGSQKWASDVDALMAEVKRLNGVIRRLAENAGIDMANPSRGINTGDTPSIKNPVGQKLSSLADTDTYNVAEGQVLSWNQQGQKWLPVTLPTPTAGGTIDISEVSYTGLPEGYGVVTDTGHFAYTTAGVKPNPNGPDYYNVETWTTGKAYYGAGNWADGPGYALIELALDGSDRPYVRLSAEDYEDGSGGYFVVASYKVYVQNATFQIQDVTTAGRPELSSTDGADVGASVYDVDLGIPIWWNGTTWINALGTPV